MEKNVCSNLNRRLTLVEEENKILKKESRWLKTKMLLQDEMLRRVYHYLPIGEEDYEESSSERQNGSSDGEFEDGDDENVDGASIEEEIPTGPRAASNGKNWTHYPNFVFSKCLLLFKTIFLLFFWRW